MRRRMGGGEPYLAREDADFTCADLWIRAAGGGAEVHKERMGRDVIEWS